MQSLLLGSPGEENNTRFANVAIDALGGMVARSERRVARTSKPMQKNLYTKTALSVLVEIVPIMRAWNCQE